MGEPARGYSWAPFAPGHTLSMSHGAHSPRMIEPVAAALRDELVQRAPWCAVPAFAPEVDAWANAEARCRLLRAYLDEHGLLTGEDHEPRPALAELHRAESQAAKARDRLGLNPRAWAAVLASLAERPEAKDQVAELRKVGAALVAGWSETAGELEGGAQDG